MTEDKSPDNVLPEERITACDHQVCETSESESFDEFPTPTMRRFRITIEDLYRSERSYRIKFIVSLPFIVITGLNCFGSIDSVGVRFSGSIICFFSLCLLYGFYTACRLLRTKYLLHRVRVELDTPERQTKFRRRMAMLKGLTVFLLIAACAGTGWLVYHQRQQTITVYTHAQELITEGDYQQAHEVLKQIEKKNYRDTNALLRLCEAHRYYDATNYRSASRELKDLQFNYQTKEQLAVIDAFRVLVEGMKEKEYREEAARREQEEYEKAEKEYEEAVKKLREQQEHFWSSWEPNTHSSSSNSQKGKESDPYYADEFYDAEDFYDWYAEDFDSYEDAEDYYYEHCD